MNILKISEPILDLKEIFDNKKVKAGFVTKFFGDPGFTNKDEKERETILENIFKTVGLNPNNAVFQNQMHTNNVKIVTSLDKNGGNMSKQASIQNNDGMITKEKNIIITAWGADCTPVYLYDNKNGIIALVHSGRKGTKLNIVKSCMNLLKKEFSVDAKDLIAILGPGICGKCYEINHKIAKDFENEFLSYKNNRVFLDLKGKIKKQLIKVGVYNIKDVDICTKCDRRFFSYRRQGVTHGTGLAYMVLV